MAIGCRNSQVTSKVVNVRIERGVESALSQISSRPIQSRAAEVTGGIFSRLTPKQAGVEEAFETRAPIDEIALGELHRGNDDAAAADLTLGEEIARVFDERCVWSQIQFHTGP